MDPTTLTPRHPAPGLSLGHPVRMVDDGQTWKGQAGREVARPQGGPAAPLEGASGGLGVLSASFYQVIFFKLLKKELTTSPGNC